MLRPLIRFTSALVIVSVIAVFAARVIGGAPRAWLTWDGGIDGSDIFIFEGTRVIELTHTPEEPETWLTWSADGRLAWIAAENVFVLEGVRIRSLTDHHFLQDDHVVTPMFLTWSPDGRLAWVEDSDISQKLCVWDGERVQTVSEVQTGYFTLLLWTAEGDLIWYAPSVEGEMIQVWDGETVRVIEEMADENQFWSDSGAPVWVSHEGGNQSVRTWDGTQVITLHNGGVWDSKYAWSADGRLAWFDEHGEINVWDGESVRSVPQLENTTSLPEYALAWSPDGRLTWLSIIQATEQVVITAWDGERTFQLVDVAGNSMYPSWSADGRLAWVTFFHYPQADQVHVWDGTTVRSVELPRFSLEPPIWSADGRLVIASEQTNGGHGVLLLWEGAALIPLGYTESPYPELHWSPPMH